MGSSPLTRGKRLDLVNYLALYGLIPAHAGKTTRRPILPYTSRAHPRSRGENARSWPSSVPPEGSSPLTRGKRTSAARARSASGLIPAHAGKTWPGLGGWGGGWAHPRSRGENRGLLIAAHHHRGSSPLTRGKQHPKHRQGSRGRLIPAHAGKTALA